MADARFRGLRLISTGMAVAIAAACLGVGCGRAPAAPQMPTPAVSVAKPVPKHVVEWDEFSGRLDSVETVELRARVSGFIESAPFEDGLLVKKGDLLFTIDARPLQAQLEKALGDVQQSQAKVAQAKNDFERISGLRATAVASEYEFDSAKQTLARSEGDLASMRAAAAWAKLNVEFCRVTAPINGRVSRKLVTAGNVVTGGEGQGTLLTTITSIDPIYCYVDVDERSVLKYQSLAQAHKRISARDQKIPAEVELTNETGFPHKGQIDFVDNHVDPKTGTIRARGVFPNPNGLLTPGFFARLRVPGSDPYDGLLVSDAAVLSDQGVKYVLLVDAKGIVQFRPVTTGPLFEGLRVVTEGIGPDDRIIVNGLLRVRPGAPADATEVPMPLKPAAGTLSASPPAPSTKPAETPAEKPPAEAPATAPSAAGERGGDR